MSSLTGQVRGSSTQPPAHACVTPALSTFVILGSCKPQCALHPPFHRCTAYLPGRSTGQDALTMDPVSCPQLVAALCVSQSNMSAPQAATCCSILNVHQQGADGSCV
jgi:hypothetical protein